CLSQSRACTQRSCSLSVCRNQPSCSNLQDTLSSTPALNNFIWALISLRLPPSLSLPLSFSLSLSLSLSLSPSLSLSLSFSLSLFLSLSVSLSLSSVSPLPTHLKIIQYSNVYR